MNLPKPHYIGHRQRLRNRFSKAPHAVADYELLEMLLFNCYPRKDVKEIAKNIIARVGSLSSLKKSNIDELVNLRGLGRKGVELLKLFIVIQESLTTPAVREDNIHMHSTECALSYAWSHLSPFGCQAIQTIFLNANNAIVHTNKKFNSASYPKISEIIDLSLIYGATSFFVINYCHKENIKITPEAKKAAVTYKNIDYKISLKLQKIYLLHHNGHYLPVD